MQFLHQELENGKFKFMFGFDQQQYQNAILNGREWLNQIL